MTVIGEGLSLRKGKMSYKHCSSNAIASVVIPEGVD